MKIFTTMITPFQADGSVDYKTAEKFVEYYYNSGIDGIFAICQSSEILFLSLDERVKLNSVVYKKAKELESKGNRKFTVVSSGHVSNSIEEQIKELNAIYKSGTDCLILITNRLDPNNDGDDVFIKNCQILLDNLPKDVRLGLYECPLPYKRLVTDKILSWCISTGRFDYMKDTCCDAKEIKHRCELVKGTSLKLFNANCQTLLQSVKEGAEGYCGIMCNFHPRLYSWLAKNYQSEQAEYVQSIIGTFGFTEFGLPYPLTAKYSMTLNDIPTINYARNRMSKELTDYAKDCVRQMKLATDTLEKQLGIVK